MHQIKQHALVPYSCQQMYALVNDYTRYPEFVPGCIATKQIKQGDYELQGQLVIAKAGIRQQFTTQNHMTPPHSIKMQLVEGPFKSLNGEWQFIELDEDCCQIVLQLEFEFTNTLTSLAFSKIFTYLTFHMIEAFKQRAKEIYG